MNDPGCMRDDCKIKNVSQFKKNAVTGIYEPVDMGKKRNRKKAAPVPKMQILAERSEKPDEKEVIKMFHTSYAPSVTAYPPRYDDPMTIDEEDAWRNW